jgi:hypothetical protein
MLKLPFQDALDAMSADYNLWLKREGLEAMCAEDLLRGEILTAGQVTWLRQFIDAWHSVQFLQSITKPF